MSFLLDSLKFLLFDLLPGFLLTFLIFPKKKEEIDWIDRIALGFSISVAIIGFLFFITVVFEK